MGLGVVLGNQNHHGVFFGGSFPWRTHCGFLGVKLSAKQQKKITLAVFSEKKKEINL